jgi:sterol desaturase/sphingolipid hydroxylase (fatty acid hydroxylase superfamily)
MSRRQEYGTMPEQTFPNPVVWAIPAFILLALAEIVVTRLRGRLNYELRDTAASLAMGIGNLAGGLAARGVVLAGFGAVQQFRLFDIGYAWWSFVLILFAEDFAYYVFHRLSHRSRFWWASHVNHHSSQHFNLSTALRQTWTGDLFGWIVWVPPLVLIGFPIGLILFQQGVSLVYQFWIHTELVGRMPWWYEAVMNTPSHHRVHHSNNPRYLDRNYAGIFIIWDKMFGTFAAETEADPCRYGLVHNIATFNPVRIAFHEWVAIIDDLRKSRSWSDRLRYVLGVPGWSPDGRRQTTDSLREAWRARETDALAGGSGASKLPVGVSS